MTTFLSSIILTAGADRMAVTDPHGWTLTLISVSVVFTALIVLYFIYSLSGYLFSRTPVKRATKGKGDDAAVAAAIALALQQETADDAMIAVSAALALELQGGVHDAESGIITIRRHSSAWNDKSLNFRKSPKNGNL